MFDFIENRGVVIAHYRPATQITARWIIKSCTRNSICSLRFRTSNWFLWFSSSRRLSTVSCDRGCCHRPLISFVMQIYCFGVFRFGTSGGGKDQGQLGNQYADLGDILCTHLLILAQRKLKLIQTQSQTVSIQPFLKENSRESTEILFWADWKAQLFCRIRRTTIWIWKDRWGTTKRFLIQN
jgi:hypothetical protein